MGRDGRAAAGVLRRTLTLLLAVVVLALIVVGGSALTPQQARTATTTTSTGRTVTVCTTGTAPSSTAGASPEPSSVVPSSAEPSGSPTPGDAGTAAPGEVAVVASGPADATSPSGRVQASRLGSDQVQLTVDRSGHGATLDRAAAPVLLVGEGLMANTGSGAVLSVTADGPERGLEAAPCLPPTTAAWFPGVASGADDRTELVLSNPDDAQAELDLKFYGRNGRVVVPGSPAVVVAAHSSRSVSLTDLVDVPSPLSVSVEATVGRVSAVARRIRTVVDQPAGADWIVPAAPPALTAAIPGIPGEAGDRELVVTNPGGVRASVAIRVLGLQGPYAPAGADSLIVPPESSASVALADGLAGAAAGIELTSDQPVTGAVTSTSARGGAGVDIAVQSARPTLVRTGVSAIAGTDRTDAELVLSNRGQADTSVSFDVVSFAGVVLRSYEVVIAADGSATRRLNAPTPCYVVVRVPDGSSVIGGVVLSQLEGPVAGLSTIPLTSPDPGARSRRVEQDPAAGR